MNRKQNSQKDINEYKIVVPMSNEAVNKIKSNITKSILGISIAGVMIAGGATQVKAETVENPTAIVEEAKDEEIAQYDQALAAAVENILPQKDQALNSDNKEELALSSVNGTSEDEGPADESQSDDSENNVNNSSDPENSTEGKDGITLDEFIKDDTLENIFNLDANEADEEEKLETSEENQAQVQKAGEEVTEPNYSEDEAKIKDYNESERYRETDLQPGDTNQEFYKTDEKEEKDGFKFELKNPSETSPSKTEYGYQITIDKKTGQRTYTRIYVTDSGLVPAELGEKPMMGQGDKLTPESPDVTFTPDEKGEMTAGGRQRNFHYEASEDTLKHINNNENDSTSFGMKDNYTKDNPGVKFFGGSFTLDYKVNPWPNENDKLELMKLSGQYNDKVFVQGQDINTGVKVDNIDDNAKERLVGQVYNPINGDIVPGASAYIGDDGNIHVKLPEGALKKDENGKTVINEDSIFNTPDYKALQNLDVKFFARPRTAEEFRNIAKTPDEFGETGKYTGSEAGTADINHKGTNVTIDKQGIDRYDHYNLIGGFKLNLDDTRYYDQSFKDGHKEDTSEKTYSKVKPGEAFDVEMYKPESPKPNQKTADEMNEADKKGEASGKLIMDFINKENEGKGAEDQWKLDVDEHDISKFTITPPKSAKAGDFVAIPVEYTYTNGSTDTHWFHFVVQESDYIKPEYDAQVNFPVNKQTSEATVAQDTKRIKPDHYTLPDTLETDEAGNKMATDDKGNKWTVTLDGKTGKVSAKPVNPLDFNGGEKLTVPVISHYVDEQKPGEDITEEANAYFVIEEKSNMTPRYNAKAGKAEDKLVSDVILNTEDKYNRRPGKYTLPDTLDTDEAGNKFITDDKGNKWQVTIDEKTGKVSATVPNPKEGQSIDGALLNIPVTAHYYEEDKDQKLIEVGIKSTEVQFVAYGTNGKVEKTEEIPFETKVEKDPNLKKGEIKVITEGKKGSKKITYTIEDSKIVKEEEQEIEKPQIREIHVGEGVNDGTHKIEEKVEVGFETEIQFDDSLAPGETKEVQKGEAGEKKRDITLTIEDGNVTKTETGEFTETKAPKKRIIKLGRNTEGKVEHKEELPFKYKVEEVDTLKKGEYKIVKPGKVGTKTTTWIIKNSKVEGEPTVTEVAAEDALIQVGKGTNEGTHEIVEKKELPFETRYEYDDSLEPGEEKVVTPGSPGEQERTNTLVIKDGKVVETKEGEFKTTKEPQERLIKIGRKSSEGETTKTIEREIPYETKVIYDDTLEAGFQKIEKEGKAGKEEVTITQKIKDSKPVGNPTETTKTITEKEDRVVRIGVKPVVKETELGHDTEYRHNPDLKEGETNTIEEGSKGSVKYTTTFNKETGKLEVKEERTEPKNKVVEYGSKTDGEFTYESEKAYDIIIRENPNLESGKTNVIQEGVVGKTETTVKIENSKEVSRETKTITEKQDKIIEVGTKNVCPIPGEDSKDPEKQGEEDSQTPGGGDSGNTDENPDEKPDTPDTPEEPGTQDEDKPNEPGTPGTEEPGIEDPEKPGEDVPSEQGEETPEEPSETGEKKPSEPGTEESVENVESTEDISETDGEDSTGKKNNPNEINESVSSGAKTLPKTGGSLNASLYGYLMGVLGSGFLGLGALKKKKEDEDEEN
ncbi:G5 domain-containing protein [Ezakiella peruensis]|uniref:G5 domain-containing protein n=1 Tax=Ezakiella peruensis TaxID=1464038 RepID=UPI001FE7F317|nr:G5 domain-containing protein [Ezakiella peruensis]